MRRSAVAALLVLAVSAAAQAGEGVYITLDGGYGMWNKDSFKQRLNAQGIGNDPFGSGLSNTDLLVDKQLQDGGLFALHLGYNIAGHVAFEGSLMLRPYDLLADTRGGAAIAGMAMRWFPLQGLVRPNRQFDISFIAGMDYVLSGGNGVHDASNKKIENTGRGFDGTAVELGFSAELYPAKWVSLGVTPRLYLMDPVRYFTNFDHRDEGGAIPLSGSGGLSFFSISLSVTFHFEPLPD